MPRSTSSAADFLPQLFSLSSLTEAAHRCRGCGLYKNATQTVFGEGAAHAAAVFVGEQPGDYEDRQGRPFVGPVGRILDQALDEAGIARTDAYITNAVKHFKWTPRGKRRMHKKPTDAEIDACRPWLIAELTVIKPAVLVCMGTTAARSAFGKTVRLKDYRGRITPTDVSAHTLVTIHPSSVLRLPERAQRHDAFAEFVAELRLIRPLLSGVR